MRVEFAYAVSVPAAVEMLTACSKKSDGVANADGSTATTADSATSTAPIGTTDHATPLTGRIAPLGKNNENGARLAAEEMITQGPALDGQKIPRQLDAKRMAPMANAPASGTGSADESAKSAKASVANTVAREATHGQAAEIRTILTNIKRVHPDGMKSGRVHATGGPLAKQSAAPGIGAKILGGDGVCTAKVGKLAGSAGQNPVSSKAALVLSDLTQGAGFTKKDEGRSHTLVQSDAPLTYEALYVIVDAVKRADSIDAPEVLAAMPCVGYRA